MTNSSDNGQVLKSFSINREEIMNARNLWFKLFVPLFAVGLLVGLMGTAGAAMINVGALNDITGATSDVGKD